MENKVNAEAENVIVGLMEETCPTTIMELEIIRQTCVRRIVIIKKGDELVPRSVCPNKCGVPLVKKFPEDKKGIYPMMCPKCGKLVY